MGNYLDGIKKKPVHFIGCGGAGMAPMALIMAVRGCRVSGSDLVAGEKTAELESYGIPVTIGHSSLNLPPAGSGAVVVYSSAVKESNPELAAARKLGFDCLTRGEMLARLSSTYQRTVSVSGSHGKTSVTAMLVHIFRQLGCDIGYLIGGKANGMPSWAAGDGDIFITEVDESDGSHTLIDSHIGLVTNVEDDHCWSVGGVEQLMNNFRNFAARAPKIIYISEESTEKLFRDHPDRVALNPEDILSPDYFDELDPRLYHSWGSYQLLNAALAVEAAAELGMGYTLAMRALGSFAGVSRRMTEHYRSADICVIEDYAHHPTELKAALSTIRKRYPERQLLLLFQPHRYARLERYLDEFAEVIRRYADITLVTGVFAAWSEKKAITGEMLAREIGGNAKYTELPWEKMAPAVLRICTPPTVIVVAGAGDIDKIIPFLQANLPS